MRTLRLALAAALACPAMPATAQVATDGSAGARATLAGPRYAIGENLGTRVGSNLLHSFGVFNIRAGEQAIFQGRLPTSNIIARITGGTASTIDGLVRVEIAGANLFLVNPSGLVFGPGASIDVPAAFYASTAQSIRLADGTILEMRATPPVSLTAAPPAAFGFDSAGAAIVLNGAQLRARDGQRIGLVGGDVTLERASTGRVSVAAAPSGSVAVVATRGAGSVALAGDRLEPSGFAAMGDVRVANGSALSATEGTSRAGGGTVFVRGGDVTIDHATVESRTRFADARGIDIGATGRLAIDASNVLAVTTGAGNAGSLRLEGRDVVISGSSLVDTSCDPGCTTGRGGDLSIVAGNGLAITGTSPTVPTFVVSNSFGGGATGNISVSTGGALTMSGNAFIQGIALAEGNGSTITLRTGSIDLSGGAQVDASTRGTGRGGNIVVDNRGDIRITGTRDDPTQVDPVTRGPLTLPSGFFANAAGAGNAGSIVVSTANLQVLNGGEISSTAQRNSLGQGGSVTVRATGLVRVDGTTSTANGTKSSGIAANTFSVGNAGTVDVSADRIEVSNDGRIQSQTQARGDAGSIRLRARQVALSGGGQVATSTFDALNGGNGGSIDVAATDSVTLVGTSPNGPVIGAGSVTAGRETPSGIFANTEGNGRGGNITVDAGTVRVADGGEISSTALVGATGRGGNIDVRATGLVRVAGASALGRPSSIAANTFGFGPGGAIFLQAERIELADRGNLQSLTALGNGNAGVIRIRGGDMAIATGGTVNVETQGRGNAGSVEIGLTGTLSINGDGSTRTFRSGQRPAVPDVVVPATGIFSQTSDVGAGGRIAVSARDIVIDRGTVIGGTTPSGVLVGGGEDGGTAGAVSLDAALSLVVRQGGVVSTFSQIAGGNAGDISIRVGDMMRVESGATISTQARKSDGGNIAIQVGNVAVIDGASITTAVGEGKGAGGNMDFNIPTLVLRGAVVSANAFGGPGGNIRIGTQSLFKSADSSVTASSALNVDGTITFDSPALDPTGELLAPPPVFLDAGAILSGRCGTRLAGRASSLVVIPRGSGVATPDELRPILDGIASGFLTMPAPQACREPSAVTVARAAP